MPKPNSLRSLLVALVATFLGASVVAAQSGPTQAQKLDSIAGAGVRENRAAGIVAVVVKGNDTAATELRSQSGGGYYILKRQ